MATGIMGPFTRAFCNDNRSAPVGFTYHVDLPGQVSAAIFDKAGRQLRTLLTGQKQQAGRHTLYWDGLDRNGKPASPGTYEWRVLRTPGFTRQFLVNVGTNPSWAAFDLWPGNHNGPTTVMIDRAGDLYVGSINSEGPPHLTKLTLDGRKKYWDSRRVGVGDGIVQIARIDDVLYLLDIDCRLRIRRSDTGDHFWDDPQRKVFITNPDRPPFADLLHAGDARPTDHPQGPVVVFPMCMAAGKDFLVVTYQKHNEVRFLWPGVDRLIRTRAINVPDPKGVAVAPDGRAFVVSGRSVVLVDPQTAEVRTVVQDPHQRYPTRLAYDPANDDLLVVQQGPDASHVRRYRARDGKFVAIYGRETGRTYGVFNPLDWGSILDIAADGQGGFVTVEEFPRRVAHFRGRDRHELVSQWFGGMQWGALCALDPADPTIVYLFPDHKHCGRGKINYAARSWELTHLFDLPENFRWFVSKEAHGGMFPSFGGQSYWTVRHLGNATFLVNNGRLSGGEGVSVVRIDERELKIVPVARLGTLHPTADKLNPPTWWLAAMRRTGYDPQKSGYDHFCYSWSDTNKNGKIDAEEIKLARSYYGYTESHFFLDSAWNVYRIVDPASEQGTEPFAWMLIPNTGKGPDRPVWDWDNARRPSRGNLSSSEFGGLTPALTGIFRDDKGSIYEVGNTRFDDNNFDVPPATWPNNSTAASRFLKWSPSGNPEWSVGVHNEAKNGPPGVFSNIRGILGEVRNSIVVLDACSPATVWTQDGLYAGSFLDGRAQDGLPEFAYQRFFDDDNHWGQVLQTPTGEVVWGAMSDQSTLFYRIQGWDGWERHSGTLALEGEAPSARGRGTGLRAEYFDNTHLAGEPVLSRVDPDIWFGPLWGAFRELKARNGFLDPHRIQVFNQASFSARWSGFLESPLTEPFVFTVYVYGACPEPNKLLGSKVRLWINQERIIDEWNQVHDGDLGGWTRTRMCSSGPIALKAGQQVPIRLEYFATGGDQAHLHLYWKSASFDSRHVPRKYLYPKDSG
jgi:hypothetical protein